MKDKYYLWVMANWYGYVCGHAWLAPLHRTLLTLSLHGLGYDNARHTGEEWFIKHILAKAKIETCIDVGANVGAYTKLLVDNTLAIIYAVEPSSSSFEALEKTTAPYTNRVHLLNAALSNHVGTATLYSRTAKSEKASLSAESTAAIQEQVRVTTLDALVEELRITKVDFIKIDTEGYEFEVLQGMQTTVKTLAPTYIQYEFNHVHLYRGTTLYQLTQLLPNYELYRLLPHGWLKLDPTQMSANIFMFCNIVAVLKPV